MKHTARLLFRSILPLVCVGVLLGVVFAAREILPQRYLPHHLWRTALWVFCHYLLLGALLGTAVGVFLVLVLTMWRVDLTAPPDGGKANVLELATSFAVTAALAAFLVPDEAPPVLGLSHWLAVAAGMALVWVIVSGYIDERPTGTEQSAHASSDFHLLWYQSLGLACVVAASHIWALALPAWLTGLSIGLCLLGAAALFRVLYRPARSIAERLHALIARAAASGARRIPVAVVAMAAALSLAGWAVGIHTRAQARASRMNVIVIAVDTLRWDAVSLLSSEEHSRDLTPNLRDRLGQRATIFSRAYSQAPWTLPSFGSIFTGLYPEQHGGEHVWSTLAPDRVTLAELMREHGYETMAILAGHYVSSEVGMTQGFTAYDESLAAGPNVISSVGVTDRAIDFLERHSDAPFFLFAHYFDPHFPYLRHNEVGLGKPRADELVDPAAEGEGMWWAKPAGKAMEALNGNLLPYKEEVAFTDVHIGRLLALIEEKNLWDNTCVVFVADHGEEFFEHGAAGHDNTLFEELVHVPLAIAAPSLDLPHVIDRPVETRWLFGSLLQLAGIAPPDTVSPTPSLLSAEDAAGDGYTRSSTCPRGRTGIEGSAKPTVWLSSLNGERHKLIEDHLKGRTMCFDLRSDPGELADLSEKDPETTTRLRSMLAERDEGLLERGGPGDAPAMDEAEKQRLKSLGYL